MFAVSPVFSYFVCLFGVLFSSVFFYFVLFCFLFLFCFLEFDSEVKNLVL